ncbi:MAG: hypothetical protein GF344_08450 [Chitinivibrionales bacterium]|nr:hypothetical protein [Chitinivibrionales bacterium]MBD3356908.1 hypothetical protein [Chitinivibrionales bacterium]
MTMVRLEPIGPNDRYHDYCLWEYEPVSSSQGKLRSINLLDHSFEVAGVGEWLGTLCRAIRNALGPFKTVWGVKFDGSTLSWELYFYDYRRLEREVSIPRVLDALKPFVSCGLVYPETRPYFMFSIDLHTAMVRSESCIEKISIYLGNPGCMVSSGISYELTKNDLVFNNLYYFFDAKTQMEDIVGKAACSAHLDLPTVRPQTIIWPELADCKCIVVANKRANDGIYFSRITVDRLLYFLRRLSFPPALAAFIENYRDSLDHLLYDVGFDYTMEEGDVKLIKGSYYGVF